MGQNGRRAESASVGSGYEVPGRIQEFKVRQNRAGAATQEPGAEVADASLAIKVQTSDLDGQQRKALPRFDVRPKKMDQGLKTNVE